MYQHRIIEVPEGEEEEKEIENLFEKIMKEYFPNLVKEIDMKVLEVERVPNKLDPKRTTPRHIMIKMPKVKDKERETSSQDGCVGRYTVPPRTTKTRSTTNLKTKTQRELTENQTEWKSDNQGIKEETFIQTCRRSETGSQAERTHGKAVASRQGGPTFA